MQKLREPRTLQRRRQAVQPPELRAAGDVAFLLGDLLRSPDLLRRFLPACFSTTAWLLLAPLSAATLSPLPAAASGLDAERGDRLRSGPCCDAGLSLLLVLLVLAAEGAAFTADER